MTRAGFRFFAIAALCGVLLGAAPAEARPGAGSSFGSRGTRTFSMPSPTPTAPGSVAPIQRSMTQEGQAIPRLAPASPFGGFGLGRGLLFGLIGGGLIGLLLGHGMGSIFWLVLQIGLIFLLVRFAFAYFSRRAAMAGNAPGYTRSGLDGAAGAPAGGSARPLTISPADYAEFERLLSDIQSAYGREDRAALRRATTPEMASYFEEELAANAAKGLVNKVSGAKLVQGDLAEAWREAGADYATVAMRFTILDMMVERASGRIVSGDAAKPEQVTEVWTFRRPLGAGWQLSAIQQAESR